jgi:alpha-N-acetylglucosaminidase
MTILLNIFPFQIPVLPAFNGHVPDAFRRIFPHANITISTWGGHFPNQYGDVCTLQPSTANTLIYDQVQTAFMNEQSRLFGTNHIYNTDTWNEITYLSRLIFVPTMFVSSNRRL